MDVMIDRANVAFEQAEGLYEKWNKLSDDAHINWCCFYLQQAIEMYLKGICEHMGEKAPYGHELYIHIEAVEVLMERYLVLNSLKKIFEDLKPKMEIFDSWEGQARYSKRFGTSAENITLAFDICKRLQKFCFKNFG